MHGAAEIVAINTFPVKGLSAQRHDKITLCSGETLPGDRTYAIETGARKFDRANPAHLPKVAFAQLMSNERLARLETSLETTGGEQRLTICRDGRQVASADLATPIGRQLIEQFLAAFLGSDLRGPPRIVSAPDHHFCDVPARFISLLNLATVRELERVAGMPLDPLRFRANLHVDAGAPLEELGWIGKTLRINGKPVLRGADAITRCEAISVEPGSGKRDINLCRSLEKAFGHDDCGIYLQAIATADIAIGQQLEIS